MIRIAEHDFHSITPGERCQRTDRPCEGVQSLVELLAMDGTLKLSEQGVSHWGGISELEIQQVREAAATLKAHMERVLG